MHTNWRKLHRNRNGLRIIEHNGWIIGSLASRRVLKRLFARDKSLFRHPPEQS